MKKNNEVMFLVAAYVLMLLVIFILPFFSVPEYSILKNTTSELGAQFAPGAWIMNLTFITLGLSTIVAGWRFLKGFSFHRMILLIFGLSLILTAFFGHAPVNPETDYNLTEDVWHSYFACITGVSYTLFAIASAFILDSRTDRTLAASAGIIAVLLSILMFESEQLRGIWQRFIFIICFGWMIYCFRKSKTSED